MKNQQELMVQEIKIEDDVVRLTKFYNLKGLVDAVY